jgi:hypothetical protein
MPLGVPLITLRRELRAETGTSLNPLQGTQAQETMDIIIDRQQRELWDAYNWPHLEIWLDLSLEIEQSLYDYAPGMMFEQIQEMYVATSSTTNWQRLEYGVKPWAVPPSGNRVGTPSRWRNIATVDMSGATPITNPVGQFELIPAPNTGDMLLRQKGQAPVNPLVADSDFCVIDSKAIVLFAAAEMLAVQKSEGAPIKLTKAQNYLRKLLQDQGADKRQNYNMGGNHRGGNDPDKMRRRVPYIDYVPG